MSQLPSKSLNYEENNHEQVPSSDSRLLGIASLWVKYLGPELDRILISQVDPISPSYFNNLDRETAKAKNQLKEPLWAEIPLQHSL